MSTEERMNKDDIIEGLTAEHQAMLDRARDHIHSSRLERDLVSVREEHARKADVLLRQAEGVNRVIYWLQTGAWPP